MGNQCTCFGGLLRNKGEHVVHLSSPVEAMSFLDNLRAAPLNEQSRSKPKILGQSWASPVPRAQMLDMDVAYSLDVDGPGEKVNQIGLLDVDGELRNRSVLSKVRPHKRSKFEVEQLFASPGSLPKPLESHEKVKHVQKFVPKASQKMLDQLSPEVLEAIQGNSKVEGPDGQALRRKLVEGTTVVFFTAGYAGKRFVFERAFELGIKSVVIEHPDSWARGLLEEGLISKFIPVDMCQSSDKVFNDSLAQIKCLGEDGLTGTADGVCTFVELSVPLVARLCEALGLPGMPPKAVDAARNKHATRAVMKKAGLPTPRNCLIRSEADIEMASREVGFPAVLKPISGAASLGVKKVNDVDDLLDSYREVVRELSSLVVVSGALEKGGGSQGVAADTIIDMTVLFEQYLDGQEVDIDVVVSDGQWRYAAVSDNGPTREPYFNETYANCPSLLPVDWQRELKKLATDTVAALGFDSGIFHVECKYTSTGPQMIEVNARMGGGPVAEVNKLVWGVDLVEECIFITLGISSRPHVPLHPFTCNAYNFLQCEKSGKLKAFPSVVQREGNDNIVWAKPLVKEGDTIVGSEDGMPTWWCLLVVKGDTPQDALDYVFKLDRENVPTLE